LEFFGRKFLILEMCSREVSVISFSEMLMRTTYKVAKIEEIIPKSLRWIPSGETN